MPKDFLDKNNLPINLASLVTPDISPAASHHHEAESICIDSDISQEDHYR